MFANHRNYLLVLVMFCASIVVNASEDLFENIAEDSTAESSEKISIEAKVDELVDSLLVGQTNQTRDLVANTVTDSKLNTNFKANVKNLILNFKCGKEILPEPDQLLACDYPKSVANREAAKCFLIDQKALKVTVAANVVYGQGGLVIPKRFVQGQNKTPLGLFDLTQPSARGNNASSPSVSSKILNPLKIRQVASFKGGKSNTKIPFEALGPIFYTDENSPVLQTSLGSPIFYGEGAKAILAQTKNQKMVILNSSAGVRVPARCK